ncbi:NAD-dependent DNA ligase LigA [Treponema brennaborense]|uniref:DNA ligase n=1 Tax=Treponema brennaborense (strain DSM 12168 / CIP 105900 / DD5/3) TaxID=906968 RepID=F4LLH5_TREBD|nr:NAD-dependent DNA ligase LigA [Treponema brennaborense]AEE16639.1 DNA ligase [Treponema brennaborense DSM 12168]
MDLFEASRVQELAALIEKYQDSYYNGEAEISDAEFDALWDELKQLDPAHPVLHRIGSDSGNFLKASHRMPMGSQEKAADPEEFLAWAEKHPYDEYLVEYKLDGASLELQYDNGVFAKAVTRGNGAVGDDITVNARKMGGVKLRLTRDSSPCPYTGSIRGEVVMDHDVHRTHFPDKANCRNAANGLMRRKDGEGCEYLHVVCYDALFSDHQFADEQDKIAWLSACGFQTVPLEICKTAQEVIDYRAKVMESRAELPYDIDGLVVKERRIDPEDAARARPDRQIAFKFSLEEAVSVVREIEWSESGATYTPIAVFDPVELAGTTVKRASLVNPNTMRALGVRLGSHIVVTKRGEIIPKIESVVPQSDSAEDSPDESATCAVPSECGTCRTALVDEGTRLYCPNKACPKRILHRLEKWITVLDIRDLGTTLIRALFDSGRVRSVSDLYTLTVQELTPYFLAEESLAKEKKSLGAEKVYKSLQSRRKISLAAFVAGFDIEGIGETLVEKLVASHPDMDTLEKLLGAAEAEIALVNGFGDITAQALVQGLAENAAEMRSLVDSGTIELEAVVSSGKLSGRSFCFTGELSVKRSEAEQAVKALGGTTKSSVVKGLSYLVTNDTESGSSKNKKAAGLGIPVIDEAAFWELVHG